MDLRATDEELAELEEAAEPPYWLVVQQRYHELRRDKRSHDDIEAGLAWCPAEQRAHDEPACPFITLEQFARRLGPVPDAEDSAWKG